MYSSTRGHQHVSASQAIVDGIAKDGGLFVPEHLSQLDVAALVGRSYKEVAKQVFGLFLDDFTPQEIDEAVDGAYNDANFPNGEVKLTTKGNLTFLELYWGPTLAFKDMALTALPHLLRIAKRKLGLCHRTRILVATSGDTGGAALSGFGKAEGFDTLVLYPLGGVSQLQEKQMLSFCDRHTRAYALSGNFDDCQTFVKQLFAAYPDTATDVRLSSANSINIGRLVPQVVYYVYAYCQMVQQGTLAQGEALDVVVPTGNFGDIFAAYLAREIGVPIGKMVCASNANNVLYDFFASGVYDAERPFYKTYSPAMDILVSSNLERLLWYACGGNGQEVAGYMRDLRETKRFVVSDKLREGLACFGYGYCSNEDTLAAILDVWNTHRYLVDPHTAVAYQCAAKQKGRALVVSTASPYKFASTVAKALRLPYDPDEADAARRIAAYTDVPVPQAIAKLFDSDRVRHVTNREEVTDLVMPHIEVRVPASTANLGCAFDIAGMALQCYNTFAFVPAAKDEVAGFADDKADDNLVMQSFRFALRRLGVPHLAVRIRQLGCDIPYSRGLGSSASCIVAGVLAADRMAGTNATAQQLLDIMTAIEGHPDNVAPAYLGGLVISLVQSGHVNAYSMPVNENWEITALIPDFPLDTKEARKVLPDAMPRADAIHNAARCALLSTAWQGEDIALLQATFDDRWHQPYRYPLIPDAAAIIEALQRKGLAVALSGAGPTLLAVGSRYVTQEDMPQTARQWAICPMNEDATGAQIQ